MDLTQFAVASFALIGLVNGVQLAIDRNWKSFAMFSIAVAAGTLFGLLKWFGLPSAEIGFLVGIGSSGVYKAATKIGGTN